MERVNDHSVKIQRLERELDEMTAALSQAWDQLVPFLQELPAQAETAQDIVPILQAVTAAADTHLAGIYLFETDEWISVPERVPMRVALIHQLISRDEIAFAPTADSAVRWAFAPVMVEGRSLGALGIGTTDRDRTFTAVDRRIIVRMAERAGNQIVAARLAHSREREALIQREIQIASDIQQSIQPEAPPRLDHIDIASFWKPAREVGGDAWGWVKQPDGRLAWFVLDVAGKGLAAALAAVSLHTALRMSLRMNLSPEDVLRAVNDEFYDPYTQTDLLATVAVLSLNLETGALQIANAGHPPVLVRQGAKWLRLPASVPPIGVLRDLQCEPQVVMLKRGDTVVVSSDGFTEIQTSDRLWGQTGLLDTIPADAHNAQAIIDCIVSASIDAGTADDDQTLVTAIYTHG